MLSATLRIPAVLSLVLVSACATLPTGPSVMALPGSGKDFDQFRADDAVCRAYAQDQIGGKTTEQAAVNSGAQSAAVGTAIGALAGAALGGRSGAAFGAGTGLLFGSVAGAGAAQNSSDSLQRRYDNAYVQCMYAKGDRVPVSGQLVGRRERYASPPPPPGYAPPPPPGS